MATSATEGERAWLDIDSHLIRDESGQWRVRCELCNKHYKLPGGRYRSLDAPTVAPEHAHEAKRNLKKHIIRIHKRTFNPSTVVRLRSTVGTDATRRRLS